MSIWDIPEDIASLKRLAQAIERKQDLLLRQQAAMSVVLIEVLARIAGAEDVERIKPHLDYLKSQTEALQAALTAAFDGSN